MSEGIPYADIIILALIAGFILLRLRSVLGSKTGNETPPFVSRTSAPEEEREDPIVQLDERKLKPREETDTYLSKLENRTVVDALNSIKVRDQQFTATRFLEGAKAAYEMAFDAFAKGDKPTLKMLLNDALYKHFSSEIDARGKQEKRTESTLVSIKAKDITDACITGNIARLTVLFTGEQVTVVRNTKNEIVEGDPSELHVVEDHWTFERDVTSKNPNWKIIET
jgi:predicted lipid-binding transport protein (Tim44 family)